MGDVAERLAEGAASRSRTCSLMVMPVEHLKMLMERRQASRPGFDAGSAWLIDLMRLRPAFRQPTKARFTVAICARPGY